MNKAGHMRFLKEFREKKKLTKYAMAKLIGMIPQTYLYLERDAKGCDLKNLIKIKRGLNLTWDELGSLIEKYDD